MREFQSHRSFREFAHRAMRKVRYIRDREADDFLETLWETSLTRQETLDGGFLFRAQVGHEWDQQDHGEGVVIDLPIPLDPDRMKPQTDRAREGRANPKGIPVIYLANDDKTAVAEVRPWVGAYVSVGSFRILRSLRIVNFDTGGAGTKFYMNEPDAQEREKAVWADMTERLPRRSIRPMMSLTTRQRRSLLNCFGREAWTGLHTAVLSRQAVTTSRCSTSIASTSSRASL